ncbi:MAG: restriction endonuclease subunit S [Holophagales bacterium]|nr:restriction endonuclease subunit S [Holophagales bacterium]MYG31793.1 restriction endonuclease subunit S [Holophagales bacterium]MYI79635.1 restriction endonuclease subunit S [Holophagales bacterium]
MNADRLLTLYDRVADAPDAVDRLRWFVLDLAIRGRLVEQAPADEPASALLKRIEAEKARLVEAGEIRKPIFMPALEEDDLPFCLPPRWAWTQIARLGVVSPRNEAPDELEASFVPMPLIAADYGAGHHHEVRPWGKIKKGYTHFAEGDVGLAKITPCFENGKSTVFRNLTGGLGSGTTELHVVRPLFVAADYIVLFLKSSHFIESGKLRMTGTAGQKRVPREYFAASPFPLPPLAEQRRIVAKVEGLMALCDQLEEGRTAREATRDRLTNGSYARLSDTEADAPTFRAHVRFAVAAFPALTARADQVKPLRETILSLAVRGRLVKQDLADEPASELMKRIAAEKARLVEAREIRKPKRMPALHTNQLPFAAPHGWTWTRLFEISRKIHYGFTASANSAVDEVRLLRITDIQDNCVDWRSVPGCEIDENVLPKFRLERGDVLIARTGGTIGKSFLVQDLPVTAVFASYLIRIQASHEVYDRYLKVLLESSVYWSQLRDGARGGGQPNVNGQTLSRMLVPVPPLAEQHRIVSRVDNLMALCGDLETGLGASEATRGRLLTSLLHEALATPQRNCQLRVP